MIMWIKKLRVIVVAIGLVGSALTGFGADDSQLRAVYNATIEAVVNEISSMKSGYPELEGFSSSVIRQDANGFSRVNYSHDAGGVDPSEDPYAFEFSMSVLPLDSNRESMVDADVKEVVFPLLGVKVVAQVQRKGRSTSFDVAKIIDSHMDGLNDLEQKFLPFQLKLESRKQVYNTSEKIVVEASLVNRGAKAFKLTELNGNSLFCTFADNVWGDPQGNFQLNAVLSLGGTIKTVLTFPGVDTAQDMWISCQYAIAYKGVRPYKRIKVLIRSREDSAASSY